MAEEKISVPPLSKRDKKWMLGASVPFIVGAFLNITNINLALSSFAMALFMPLMVGLASQVPCTSGRCRVGSGGRIGFPTILGVLTIAIEIALVGYSTVQNYSQENKRDRASNSIESHSHLFYQDSIQATNIPIATNFAIQQIPAQREEPLMQLQTKASVPKARNEPNDVIAEMAKQRTLARIRGRNNHFNPTWLRALPLARRAIFA